MRTAIVMLAALALAGCGAGDATVARPAAHIPVPGSVRPGPTVVSNGETARQLIALYGQPRLDVQEGSARKLQFASPMCVLDAYLYPPARGRGEASLRHVDVRRRDGSLIDAATCMASFGQR